jgi:hypothetical protein
MIRLFRGLYLSVYSVCSVVIKLVWDIYPIIFNGFSYPTLISSFSERSPSPFR